MSVFDNATLMITGGTGSFGSTVLKHFLDWFHILPNFQNQIFDMDEGHINLQKLDTN